MKRLIMSIDVETTDLGHETTAKVVDGKWKIKREGAVVQLSGQLCSLENNVLTILDTFDYRIRPHGKASISQKALDKNGFTTDQLLSFAEPAIVAQRFKKLLRKNMSQHKYAKWDKKYFWLGYNHFFDKNHVSAFFKRYSDKSLNDFTNWHPLEIYSDTTNRVLFSNLNSDALENFQLGTFCKRDGIEINAHDAFSDSLATLKEWCNHHPQIVGVYFKERPLEMYENWNEIVKAEDVL